MIVKCATHFWANEGCLQFEARVLGCRRLMGSLVARTGHSSPSRSSAVAGVWRSVLQHLSYSDEGLDARVPPSQLAADRLSGDFSPVVPKTQTFEADRPVYERNSYPRGKWEGFRVYRTPRGVSIAKLTPKALNAEEPPVSNCIRAYRNVAQEACYDSPGQGFGRGNSHLPNTRSTSEAIAILKHRQQQGLPTDSYMFVEILKLCSKQKNLIATREVHHHIIQSGMQKHPYVVTTLLNVYVKCGRLQDAHRVFDGLERTNRNVTAWNVVIGGYAKIGLGMEAYRLFLQMKREGFIPDAFTYASILNPSASAGALEWVREVHGHARRAGLESDLRVGSQLVHMYAKCGSVDEARLVFDRMEKRDVITWNIMIGGYAESGCGLEAYGSFLQMEREGFIPDAFTYASILNASASAEALEWVKEVHGHVRRAGLESDLRVGNALVHIYARCGRINEARLVFDRMEKRDVITWNIMIGGYAESGCGLEAFGLFLQMKREGFIPDVFTYMSILNASASAEALEWVKEVHAHARRAGLDSDLRVLNALLHMYAKSGSIDEARVVFDRMPERNVITWNIMIGGYAESGCDVEAYRHFLQMKREGFIPNAITYTNILNASASEGALEWVKEVHEHARRAGLEWDLRVGGALVHMYAKSGSIDMARLVFDRMINRDVVIFNIMIGGLAQHGCGHEALKLFKKMNTDGVRPDGPTFVAVLLACCHAGLVGEGRELFLAMKQDYGVEATVVHYTIMVDLLGRAGHLKEAKHLIATMPVEPNAWTWTTLLGACRTYGNVELGEIAADEVLKLEPTDAGPYVLLSNIYAAAGKWDKVSSVRTMMEERGVRKEPGRSWIEVDNEIHEFFAGDISHPEAKAIYSELEKLTEKMKAKGYIPDTKVVTRNIDEEEKELALCSHSEKLAIAYGLLRVPRENPIHVKKNLRVCADCHTATKLISEVTGREIIVRDANRFHHFKDGVCSCGNYW